MVWPRDEPSQAGVLAVLCYLAVDGPPATSHRPAGVTQRAAGRPGLRTGGLLTVARTQSNRERRDEGRRVSDRPFVPGPGSQDRL
jgi:hypothetical protein